MIIGAEKIITDLQTKVEYLEESDRALSRVWEALGVEKYTGLAVWEHVAILRKALEEIAVLPSNCSPTTHWYGCCGCISDAIEKAQEALDTTEVKK